ncbi:MAG: M48 family metalloprotease [Oscillatoriaceae bacterium SKW80]|nr:M48 family metalloprotease [Oscillatoriaceae bacterium SKYG93]MCX8120932.1 M48 family metalloprotease [Oscillatoriaceae bacterium SKW80]MDW8452205.1 M48 family metalloprotease [Oscillatoriaceae cyanobacterium SKYGB_i_bin93]HIK26541.1 M48 family metalloprotease [Oscillatoriaceae cyanobacterium M7585_C2015_266]
MRLVLHSLPIVLLLVLSPASSYFAWVLSAEFSMVAQATAAVSSEEVTRLQKFAEADRLYRAGDVAAAEKLYRELKPSFAISETEEAGRIKEAITDWQKLSAAGQVYWQEAQAELEQNLPTKAAIALQLLLDMHPEFVPGYELLVRSLLTYGDNVEALKVLERATILFPERPELLRQKIELLAANEKWLEGSIAARQFAILNPHHPQATEFLHLAEENWERFRRHLRRKLRENTIASVITGVFTLMKGENALGERTAQAVKQQLPIIEDKEVVAYINEIGKKLAYLSGRNFEYEFYVIRDKDLNAFALPGGKIFINAGAILQSNSEAELAGLLAHELAHTILSHSFQRIAEEILLSNVTQIIPLGDPLTNLVIFDYSHEQEQQADILGTRMLVAAGYAADGLYNLMVTLKERKGSGRFLNFLSTQPPTTERINYLAKLIQRNGYNRYTYEGVERHGKIKARLEKILKGINPDKEKKHMRSNQ